MSVDLAFWKSGKGTPEDLYDLAADGDVEPFEPSPSVVTFRENLLERWPRLMDCVEPLEFDPDLDEQKDLSHYVLLTLNASMSSIIPAIINLAMTHGLTGYDPQGQSAFK